jgi:membrane protease YdiL (CAAX protease family)
MIVIQIIFSLSVNLVYFDGGYYRPLAELTHGWVGGTLSANLIGLFVEVIVFLFIIVKIPPRDLGLRKDRLLPGFIGFLLFWFVVHMAGLGVNLFTGSSITFNDQITNNPADSLGALFGQLFGNALLEEIVFRGFLFVQVFLLCGKIKRHYLRVAAAILLSQTIFALMHIPNRIYSGYAGMEFVYDFFLLVILGTVFCLLYWLTKNLFVVVGIHSLINVQLMLWHNNYTNAIVLSCVLAAVVLLILIAIIRRRSHRVEVHI